MMSLPATVGGSSVADRLRGPGAFRLFLAALVFVDHFCRFRIGLYAVYVFFILSGFWVTRMWMDRYRLARSPYLTFIVSRLWRLCPVVVLASLMSMPLLIVLGHHFDQIIAGAPVHLLISSIFIIGYCWLSYPPVTPAWSLDLEVQFYAVAPFIIMAAKRVSAPVALVLAALVSVASTALVPVAIMPSALLLFVTGVTAARYAWCPSSRLAALSAGAALTLIIAVAVSPWRYLIIDSTGTLFRYNLQFCISLP